jgi:hypothetical protein
VLSNCYHLALGFVAPTVAFLTIADEAKADKRFESVTKPGISSALRPTHSNIPA